MDENKYTIDKNKINNSNKFKSYIYKKYAIISICIIIILNILISLNNILLYNKAKKYYKNENYSKTTELLNKIPHYKDSSTYLRKTTIKNLNNFKLNDTIYLGTYSDKPLSWEIIDISNDNYLIILEGYLEIEEIYKYWDKSNLRIFLNNRFYYEVFNSNEKEIIKDSIISNDDKLDKYTIDKIFILNENQSKKYKVLTGDNDLLFRDENIYFKKTSHIRPVLWLSKSNNDLIVNSEGIKLTNDYPTSSTEEKDIYKTEIGMYDFLLKESDGSTCYYWRGQEKNYYTCYNDKDGIRKVNNNNLDKYAKEDILKKRGNQNEE